MREERGTILFRDVAKKFGFVAPSSSGDKSGHVSIGSADLPRAQYIHYIPATISDSFADFGLGVLLKPPTSAC
jgi:hypothetical protein